MEPPAIASPLDGMLGLTLEHVTEGVATLVLSPGDVAVVPGAEPFLHGGALATCVDTASWYAAVSASPGEWVVASMRLDFLRPARVEPHRVLARCRRAGRTSAVVDVEIAPSADLERVVALGRVSLARA